MAEDLENKNIRDEGVRKMERLIKKMEFLFGMPIFYKKKGEKIRSFGTFLQDENPLFCSEKIVSTLIAKTEEQDVPVVYKDINSVYFWGLKSKEGYYMSGPVCIEAMNRVEVHRFYKEYGIASKEEKPPVKMSLVKLLNLVSLFYELLEGEDIDIDTLSMKNHLSENKKDEEEKEKIRIEMEKNNNEIYHHTYQEERYMLECVREGNAEQAVERMWTLLENAGKLSKNSFNDQRYLAVVVVTLSTREAISGGVSTREAYRKSDFLINQIDKCTQIDQLVEIMRKGISCFADMVADCKKNRDSCNYTGWCKEYIAQNYHHKISINEMAEKIGISSGHLSREFRKNTGMQIQEYIQKFRVERVANLLKYSEASIIEISEYVCFHSQSHLGRVFKKYMGMTPGEYRKRYKPKEFQSQ